MTCTLAILFDEIGSCRVCEEFLPLGPRPVVSLTASSRILIIGQAPGSKVHDSGVPWDDVADLGGWEQLHAVLTEAAWIPPAYGTALRETKDCGWWGTRAGWEGRT